MTRFLADPVALPIRRTSPFSPPAWYADLRADQPVKRVMLANGQTAWLIARHADVRAALKDVNLSSDPRRVGFPEPEDPGHSPLLTETDPPEHTAIRRILAAEFSPSRLAHLRGRVQADADLLVDKMLAKGRRADLLTEYALPIPSLTICHLLGVPYEDMPFFQSKLEILSGLEGVDKARAYGEVFGYFDDLVTAKELSPENGLIDRLVIEQLRTRQIDHHGLVKIAFMLLMAGFETTATMIALGIVTLLHHSDQLVLFCANPGLTDSACEELLRYHSIADSDALRVAVADTEIGGQRIAAGEGVIPLVWSANRDSAVFDQPDIFDIRRDSHGQLAFGYGIHQCIGLNLARLEMRVALRTLFDRVPDIRLTVPVEDLPFRYDAEVFGLKALPVAW